MNKKKLATDKFLVVEQKGWRIVILGLAIAALFSLTFKAVFSSRRIQYEIERALSAGDPRIKSTLNGAHLSLSDGFLPRLAIVIDSLKVETQEQCLFQTKAEIQNLVLPVAFSSLLDRMLVFKRIEVGLVNIWMSARREGCGETKMTHQEVTPIPSALPKPAETAGGNSPVATPVRTDVLERPPLVQTMSVESSFLRHIIFHEAHLHFVEWPTFHWSLKNVDVHLPQKGVASTHIEGTVTLTSDQKKYSFQGLHARLELDSDSQETQAKLHGAWREGRVEIEGRWAPTTKAFHWNGSFKQIPWSQLVVLAHSLGKADPLPASSQAWVSAELDWEHNAQNVEKVVVDEGHIEGEFGDFVLGKVVAEKEGSVEAWKVEPYKVLAKEVDLDLLTKMLGWQEPPSAFDRLGLFDGEAQFTENQLVSMAGVWRELQLIFSNRGLRELQTVNSMNIELTGGSNRWAGLIKNIDLEDGNWKGDFGIKLDQNLKTVDLDARFAELKLNPEVIDLMTVDGQVSPIDGRVQMKFVDGFASQISGSLKFDHAIVNNVSFEKARFDFDGSGDLIKGKGQLASLTWPRARLDYWPQPLPVEYESLVFKGLNGQFNRTSHTFDLHDVQGNLVDLKTKFNLEAGWLPDGRLHGALQLKSDRKTQAFSLAGTRQSPLWTEKTK